MAAPLDPAKLDHAIQLYLAGEPQQQILAATGISSTTLHRERTRRGIPPRREHVLPTADLTAAYAAGESEYSLSLRYGVSRNVIRRRLIAAGVEIRDMSAAGKVRARRMTPEERRRQAAAAHAAVRGSRRSEEELLRRAMLREQRGLYDSPGELFLFNELVARGLKPVPQKAIGKYNVDLAVAPVAVEVLGGGWHLEKRHHSVRTPQILNAGWHLVFVWNHEGSSALTARAADYIVAFLDEVGRQPPTIGQYRVISGDGQLLAAGSGQDDKFPLVPPPRGGNGRRP